MSSLHTKRRDMKEKAIGTKGLSSMKQRVFRVIETFSLINGVEEDSDESTNETRFPHVAHEQMMQSRAEAELKKAEAQAWYMRQKNRIM